MSEIHFTGCPGTEQDCTCGMANARAQSRAAATAPSRSPPAKPSKLASVMPKSLTPEAESAIELFLVEKRAQAQLSSGELQMAARLGVTAAAFIGLRHAQAKIDGADGPVWARAGVTDDELRVAKAIGLDPEKYAEHKLKVQRSLTVKK